MPTKTARMSSAQRILMAGGVAAFYGVEMGAAITLKGTATGTWTGANPGTATGTFKNAKLTGAGPGSLLFRMYDGFFNTALGTTLTGLRVQGTNMPASVTAVNWLAVNYNTSPATSAVPPTTYMVSMWGFGVAGQTGIPASSIFDGDWGGVTDDTWLFKVSGTGGYEYVWAEVTFNGNPELQILGYGSLGGSSAGGGGSGGGPGGSAGTPEPAASGLALLALGAAGVMRKRRNQQVA